MGLAFMGSLGDVNEIAPDEREGDIVASYYVVVYLATALPAIGVAAVTVAIDPLTAIQVFAYAVITVCLAGLGGLLLEMRTRKHSNRAAERQRRAQPEVSSAH
jgi:hypothetical protein